jgi:predicted small metal-binding protein
MTETPPVPPLSTFVLRFWREWSAGETQWRGRIEHVQSGASATFPDLEGMVDFVLGMGVMADARNRTSRALPIQFELSLEPQPNLGKEKKMKVFQCCDAGFDCKHVVRAESEEELLRQVAEHAETAHHVEVTPELAEQVKRLIRQDH